jgi:hypothetical protein
MRTLTGVQHKVGFVLMQTFFTCEHDTICDMFQESYPSWTDKDIVVNMLIGRGRGRGKLYYIV